MNIALIDNYDSFTYNLAQAVQKEGGVVTVHRNDQVTRDALADAAPDGLILSPGPGHPRHVGDIGVCRDLIETPIDVPMLGVCLGMQAMAHCTGGRVVAAPEVVHGEADEVGIHPDGLFKGMEVRQVVGRYHSLCVDVESLPDAWEPTAVNAQGTLMAMTHTRLPWIGVQFHPESILTPNGQTMVRNFLEMCR